MTWPTREPADLIARLGRHWGWLLGYGILTGSAGESAATPRAVSFTVSARNGWAGGRSPPRRARCSGSR